MRLKYLTIHAMKKIRLEEIKVKSFVTSLAGSQSDTIKGGAPTAPTNNTCYDTCPIYTSVISGSTSDTTWSDVRDTISKARTEDNNG